MTAISILMPVFNADKYLSAAIDSIRYQCDSDWELLCIDDGSTDASSEILAAYAASDARIRVVSLSHRGIVEALNYGVRLARGKFIARLDADDLAKPHRLRLQREYLEEHTQLAMVGGEFETIDAMGNVWRSDRPPQHATEVNLALRRGNCLAHSSVFIRRDVLNEFNGPYRNHFPLAEDYDLWLRMAARFNIGNVPAVVLSYRRDLAGARPSRTIQQTISTVAARWLNQLDQQAQGQLLDDDKIVDRETLIDLGYEPKKLDGEIARALLSEARVAKKLGFLKQSDAFLREAWHYRPNAMDVGNHLRFVWRMARVHAAA